MLVWFFGRRTHIGDYLGTFADNFLHLIVALSSFFTRGQQFLPFIEAQCIPHAALQSTLIFPRQVLRWKHNIIGT